MGVGRDSGTAGGREAGSVVPWRPARDPDTSDGHFPPVEPGQYEVDGLVCTRDIAATLTDGTVIYVDQYRLEAGPERLPVILCWGTSGKRRGYARGGGPWHLHTREQPLTAGKPVALDIALWPTSRIWRAGEILRLHVCGRYAREEGWFEPRPPHQPRTAARKLRLSGVRVEDFDLASCRTAAFDPARRR
jgi:predicted acyl esterase